MDRNHSPIEQDYRHLDSSALVPIIGNIILTDAAEDVTPPPYNQPPYPAAGVSNTSNCTVTAFAP